MFGLFGNAFDLNHDGEMDGLERSLEFATFASIMDECEKEEKGYDDFDDYDDYDSDFDDDF